VLSKDRYRIKRKFSIGMILIAVVLGALIGATLGEAIGVILPEGVVKDFLIKSASIGFSPVAVNLVILSFTIGFTFHLNIIGVIGIIIAAYILRWFA